MKLVVLEWVREWLKQILGRTIEIIFRVVLFFLPLGIFMTILQFRSKVSSTSNLTVYTKDESVWQHVFPGFILVSIDPKQFKNSMDSNKEHFQRWVKSNQYLLAFLFMLAILVIMICSNK